MYLSSAHRPSGTDGGSGDASSLDKARQQGGADYGETSRAAVLADAEALLACYRRGEDRGDGREGRGVPWGEAGQPVRCGGAGLRLNGAVLLLFGPPRRSRLLSKPQHTSHTSTPHLRSMGENAVASQLPGGGGAVPGGSTGGTSGRRLLLSGPSGVAVEMGPPHVIVELAFTSSVRFLQPGLLLQVRGGGAG